MSYRLMIVEDEQLEMRALKAIIWDHLPSVDIVGYAISGKEAIQLAKKEMPDIILLDIGIPEMDGLSAQQEIIKFLPDVKTIVLTAYSDFNHAQSAISSKVVDYLLKPVRKQKIIEAVSNVVESLDAEKESKSNPVLKETAKNDVVQKALRYIEKHYSDELQLNQLANSLYVNSQYLSRLFKKELDLSFNEYVTIYRINKAKTLLTETQLPVYSIAAKTGFTDTSYFCKKFNIHTGFTPLTYRRTYA
ncbi:response regulator transcription factor [Amphibacillus sp. Q70]|uniref:response regulator transcription factor n=1 Tax=Amphibacillus sp. Q70 TaxID=3453416 RepID=UPI003F86F67D